MRRRVVSSLPSTGVGFGRRVARNSWAPAPQMRLHPVSVSARHLASTIAQPLSESTFGILDRMMQIEEPAEEVARDSRLPGRVLSVAAGIARVALPGSVSLGGAVRFDGCDCLGVIVGFDRQGALVALLSGTQPRLGAEARCIGEAVLRSPGVASSGGDDRRLSFTTPTGLLEAHPIATAEGKALTTRSKSDALLRLPSPPMISLRNPATERLPSGLAAVEIVAPLAQGHRIGFTGAANTGKTRAAEMLMRSQPADTICVYAALRPEARLRAALSRNVGADAEIPKTIVVHADPAQSSTAEQYLVPLCAAHIAQRLLREHSKVLLVLDDVVHMLDVESHLAAAPFPMAQVVTSALEMAASTEQASLTALAVVDVETDDELPRSVQQLWRSIEPSLDVHVEFSSKLASEGVLPAIDLNSFLLGGFPAPFQSPLMRMLRAEVVTRLQSTRELLYRSSMRKQLGLQLEVDEEEDANSASVQSALLSHAQARPLPELVVIATAALVYHFPTQRPNPTAVAAFQDAVVSVVQQQHEGIWKLLCVMDSLKEADAQRLLLDLGQALLRHRMEFQLARPELL
mmetsp:Transcript_31842/g.74410  ORF Transcript_31842/g.74410 Transcript_31842/m.74410 type:complete len:574 (+) Transcript_31842:101-1822(+)